MKLLVVNSNTSDFVTGRVAEGARIAARPGTDVVAVTGRFGAKVIATRTELAVAEHATVELLAEHAPGCDAAVIAVSYDCGLWAAREMLDIPVVGITEAALLTACMLGTRIGMVVFGVRVLPIYREVVDRHGLSGRVVAWRGIASNAPYSAGDTRASDALAIEAAIDLAARDDCEAVVLTGAVMAGVATRLQPRVPVPIVDGVTCAVRMAQMLVDAAPAKARTGSLAPLPAREQAGLGPALAARFGATGPAPVSD
jgi:allantoin racemase